MSNIEKGTPFDQKKPARLGRGLGSLFGDIEVSNQTPKLAENLPVKSPGQPALVNIDLLYPNPHQPRRDFVPEKLQELANSIKMHGIIQPILVMPDGSGKYQIVAGERRWRASQLAGLKQVSIITQELSERKSLELAIIENIQRHDLNPVEEAKAYNQLMKKFGLTQQEVAERIGKDRVTVANLLRVLSLESEIQDLLSANKITLGHAKVLLSVENKIAQRRLARKIINENLSVRALEKLVSRDAQKITTEGAAETKTQDQFIKGLSEALQKKLGTRVGIDYLNGRGQINISFYSKEQLNEIVNKIG